MTPALPAWRPPFLKAWLVLAAVLATPAAPRAQALAGFVEDATTGERLVGATVSDGARGAATNEFGYFALTVSDATGLRVRISHVGYVALDTTLAPSASPVRIGLQPGTSALGEVEVQADDRDAAVPGALRLTARDVERVPALLGEADPLRALQLSPAVRVGSEGSTGLHVRGGSPDQTLLLLDGAPVYNAAHLAGAVSVFNSDALQSVLLVPGAPPARYGGRLSAVVDVTQREGARDRRRGTATVGLLASRGLVEGPLADGRGSYVVAARRSYADALLAPLTWRPGYAIGYYLQDGSAKVNLDLDDRTRVYASAYGGRDRFYRREAETFESSERTERLVTAVEWGNTTATVRATRVVSPRAFASGLVYVSRYGFSALREASDTFPPGSDRVDQSVRFEQSSGLTDLAARGDLDLALGRHAVSVGAEIQRRAFRPASLLRERGEGSDVTEERVEDRVSTVGAAAYVSDAVRIGPVHAEGGLRLGVLAVRGQAFAALQPRLALSAPLGLWTARASAGRTWQPLHLLSNPGVGLPTDLWVPATDRVGPASAWQAAASVERAAGDWTGSVGAFAKAMTGLVEYRDGGGFFASGDQWEEDVTTGTGRAYGLELALGRASRRTDLQVGYAWSRSSRAFEDIDAGRRFPYRYDRTHDLSVIATRHLTLRRRVTALFVYATGAAVTLPVARAGFNDYVYGTRNGSRLPAYHRLDLAYEVDYGRGRLALGLSNAYNRLNPYYAEFEPDVSPDGTVGDRLRFVALFPALPSASWRFTL